MKTSENSRTGRAGETVQRKVCGDITVNGSRKVNGEPPHDAEILVASGLYPQAHAQAGTGGHSKVSIVYLQALDQIIVQRLELADLAWRHDAQQQRGTQSHRARLRSVPGNGREGIDPSW